MPKREFINLVKDRLTDRTAWTAGRLAEEIECNERTVRRCIEHLRNVEGWPVESGKDGYILREPSLAETKVEHQGDLSVLAIACGVLNTPGKSELGLKIRAELARLCRHSKDLGEIKWQDLEKSLRSNATPGQHSLDHNIHGKLTLAIVRRQICDIEYRRLEHDSRFMVKVYPHLLICRDGVWYLVAEDLERGGQRTYALPRISRVTTRKRPRDFQEPVFIDDHQHAFGIWTPFCGTGKLHDVHVELRGYWARLAQERSWHPSQQLEILEPDRIRLRFKISSLVEVKTWILGFGGSATVLEPELLREMIQGEIREMIVNHG